MLKVKWLTEKLEGAGIIAAPLSGDSSKDDRAEIMRRLQVQPNQCVLVLRLTTAFFYCFFLLLFIYCFYVSLFFYCVKLFVVIALVFKNERYTE